MSLLQGRPVSQVDDLCGFHGHFTCPLTKTTGHETGQLRRLLREHETSRSADVNTGSYGGRCRSGGGFMRRIYPHFGPKLSKYEYDSGPRRLFLGHHVNRLNSAHSAHLKRQNHDYFPGWSRLFPFCSGADRFFFDILSARPPTGPQRLLELSAMISVVHSGDCSVRSWWWYHMVM